MVGEEVGRRSKEIRGEGEEASGEGRKGSRRVAQISNYLNASESASAWAASKEDLIEVVVDA